MTTTAPAAAITPARVVLQNKRHRQWVCFTPDKVPYTPSTGDPAEADDPNTWDTLEEAVKACRANQRKYAGIGREFIKKQRITGVDLDDCIDENGNLTPFAQKIVNRLNSYTEYSPSKRGLHIWVYGNIPDNIGADKKADGANCVEMYDTGRYFTWTGKHLEGTPETIEDRQEELTAIHAETRARRKAAREQDRPQSVPPTPRQIITQANGDTRYGLAALEGECSDLASTPEGGRNQRLNDAAFKLGSLITGGELSSRSSVESALSAAAERAGLDPREIERTMRSGIEAGMRTPRKAPEKPAPEPRSHALAANNGTSAGAGGDNHSNGATPTDQGLCKFPADDSGNGDAMLALFGQDFLWCSSRGWFVYTDTHWQLDADGAQVKRKAVETLRRRRQAAVATDGKEEAIVKCTKADESRVNGCVSRFKTLVSVSIDEFDSNPDVLNCKNGVVDLRTGNIEEHNRGQRFTYCLPVEYKQADCLEWIEFLESVIGGGQDVIDYLQETVGYSLTGHTREEILFYLFGPPRAGKGTFAETIMKLLPTPLSTMVDFNSFTAKREGDVSNFDLAPLKPARMIFASESNRAQSLNPAKIKQLTGGDYITCSFKHRDFFSYRPQFKVWMMSNHPVNGDPEDDALWGRVRVIEFPNSFLGMEDKGKKARLKEPEALTGVLYWAVQGAIQWYARGSAGLATPKTITETTEAQRGELDYVQQWLKECCEVEGMEEHWEANEDVIASYTIWCNNNNVQYPKKAKALAQSLKTKGYTVGEVKKIKGKSKRCVIGLYVYPETYQKQDEGKKEDGK